ncbi:uridine kinase [Bradyrhizobium sp. NFR13]|jgi:uridine kinase|nr:uridine kinase [Bradyrhizobium sp. NFR13]
MNARANLLRQLGGRIAAVEGRTAVAIDGVDGSGKTTFADELAPILAGEGRTVTRASIDAFHNPRSIRYRRGKSDPEGFFLDSYNYADLRHFLLDPFRAGADVVDVARYDHAADVSVSRPTTVDPSAILLIDGIFLHRDELRCFWDFSIFLSVPFPVSYERMACRDGSPSDPLAPQNRRYYEGQRIYLRRCQPDKRATVVIDNSVIDAPVVLTGTADAT